VANRSWDSCVLQNASAKAWLDRWAEAYDCDYARYEPAYRTLMERHRAFTADDFREIGKWKDQAWGKNRYKPNVASVAHEVWELAARKKPECPLRDQVREFLDEWAKEQYASTNRNGPGHKSFGVARATTLLHFLSGAEYPIFDSRVRKALVRLLGQRELKNEVSAYCDHYIALFSELAAACGTKDLRKLDKALFSYGALSDGTLLARERGRRWGGK